MANGPNKPSKTLKEYHPEENNVGAEDADQLAAQEVASLSATIEQLDSCLDNLEQKNDSLTAKLQELLQSMKDEKEEDQTEERVGKDENK